MKVTLFFVILYLIILAIQLQFDRIIESKDWATILFIICVAIIAINKTISSVRFNEFVRLAYSDKYTKIYRDSSNLMSGLRFRCLFCS